jgi:hypothetical protein
MHIVYHLTRLQIHVNVMMFEYLPLLEPQTEEAMSATTSDAARIRVNIAAGELEIEGTEAFVSRYADSIDTIIERLLSASPVPQPSAAGPPARGLTNTVVSSDRDEPFGEVLHSLASKSGTDQILLSGYYVAKGSSDGTFSTGEAHALLIEQGVKLSNASQSMKNNLSSKRVFKVGSRFKVAKTGSDYLKSLGVSAS